MPFHTQEKFRTNVGCRQTKPRIGKGYLAFINQESDGLYSGARMVREVPKRSTDIYKMIKSSYTGAVSVKSYRRNSSHRSLAIFGTKKDGPSKQNILFLIGSGLDLDPIGAGSPKTIYDVYVDCYNNKIDCPTYIIETSDGHFHLIWIYENPLPWTPKNARWWESQQRRLIELFKDFGPDECACLNPVQFYRNWSQLNPYNYKRGCEVSIYKTRCKTSLGAIQHALDRTDIENPHIPAETIIRQDLRGRKYITETYAQWGKRLGLSERTMKREIPKLIKSGTLIITQRRGSNKPVTRITTYESLIYLELYTGEAQTAPAHFLDISGGTLEAFKTNHSANARLLATFLGSGVGVGLRNKAIFACGLFEKCRGHGKAGFAELYERLYPGFLRSGTSEAEYKRTVCNVLKSQYAQPLSEKKLVEWGLL